MLGKLSVPGRPIVGQGSIALTVGTGGSCLDIFSLACLFSFLSPSLGDGSILTKTSYCNYARPAQPSPIL